MSWFDTKGLASLAKTALKEAQKQIDKALDIQDETPGDIGATTERERPKFVGKNLPGGANREKSKTEPNTPVAATATDTAVITHSLSASTTTSSLSTKTNEAAITPTSTLVASTWGSFTGSFFDNPNSKEMVTTPPKISAGIDAIPTPLSQQPTVVAQPTSATTPSISSSVADGGMGPKRQSVTSNSDSVELLSPPTSPCSALTSPSEAVKSVSVSESVEQITTPTTSEIISPDTDPSLPESIVIIASDEDEEDSMSYNTVMDDTLTNTTMTTNILLAIGKQQSTSTASEDSKSMISDVTINPTTPTTSQRSSNNLINSSCSSTGASKLLISMDDAFLESQTVNSDSTQSFEDVQMVPISSNSDTLANTTDKAHSVSSDDKSDLVKIASGPSSSDHNSNDEIETTTSSDIEIISNPNGDSSSTNSISRASPLKPKKLASGQSTTQTTNLVTKKGHFREPSEISILSEDSQSEIDKLLMRISELNEILEAREMRLVEFGRQNAELQDRNNELQVSLDIARSNTAHLDSAEEYTQRLSALEKKFQASIRERDTLKLQLKTLKDELQATIPKNDLEQVVAENNIIISELSLEGEKLSKEILQQSTIIKKLRAKEKASDALLKKNKDQISDLTEEVERLKKTLNAKEEVERSQIEAVHKMSSEKRKLDEENAQQRSKIEDLQTKLITLQISFDAVKVELQQRTRLNTELTRTAEEASLAIKDKEKAHAESKEMLQQLNELREKLRQSEQSMTSREQKLREENTTLLRRLEESEMRAENLTQEVGLTTIPLMRQLEALQTTLTQRTLNWNKQEKELLDKLENSQTRLKSLESVESNFEEKIHLLQQRCLNLEEKLSSSLMEEEKSKISLRQAELDFDLKESQLKRQISNVTETLKETQTKLSEILEINKMLEEKLETHLCHSNDNVLKAQTHNELTTANLNEVSTNAEQEHQQQRPQSPNLSLGRNSMDEAMGASFDWQVDDLDCGSSLGRQAAGSVYGMHISLPFVGHNTTTLEHLQALLKQRDGEVSQLQWELSRMQAERIVLNDEISNLTLEIENMKDKLLTHETLEENFADLQHQYDALLQMYGEKVELTEELKLDLSDVREAYKAQIDELLAQPQRTS